MSLGEEANRAPFLLAAKEDADIVAVASALVALSRLTIIPSVPPDAVSGDWTWGGWGLGISPRLWHPHGLLACVGGGLYL